MRTSFRRTIRASIAACLNGLFAFNSFADVLEGSPDVIVCQVIVPGGEHGLINWVYYLSSRTEGLHARYNTMGTRSLRLKIDNEGNVVESSKSDCENKTVEQLKTAGQTFSFKKL